MTDLIKDIKARLEEEAARLHFEEAAGLRDTLDALENASHKQIVVSPSSKDQDVVAVQVDEDKAIGFVFKVREGKLVGKEVADNEGAGKPPKV
jgi:excinuclease ABC subunit C